MKMTRRRFLAISGAIAAAPAAAVKVLERRLRRTAIEISEYTREPVRAVLRGYDGREFRVEMPRAFSEYDLPSIDGPAFGVLPQAEAWGRWVAEPLPMYAVRFRNTGRHDADGCLVYEFVERRMLGG